MTAPRRLKVSGLDAPACHRCRGELHLIEGDGVVVCRDCVDLLGHIAQDPDNASDTILGALLERHRDVVRLGAHDGRLAWEWVLA